MVVEATTVRQVPDSQKQQIDIAWQTGATDAASCLSFDEIHWITLRLHVLSDSDLTQPKKKLFCQLDVQELSTFAGTVY